MLKIIYSEIWMLYFDYLWEAAKRHQKAEESGGKVVVQCLGKYLYLLKLGRKKYPVR